MFFVERWPFPFVLSKVMGKRRVVLCSFQGEGGPSLRLCFEGKGVPFVLSTVKGRAPLFFKGTGGVWAFLRVLTGGAPSFVVEVKWAGPAPFYLPSERAVPSFLVKSRAVPLFFAL